jgi:hypothetical protein
MHDYGAIVATEAQSLGRLLGAPEAAHLLEEAK